MRNPAFCIFENKGADQLSGNRESDQRLCFRYTDSTIPLLPKSKISSLLPSSVTVQPGLCQTRSETPKTGFLRTRLICHKLLFSAYQISKLNDCHVVTLPRICGSEVIGLGLNAKQPAKLLRPVGVKKFGNRNCVEKNTLHHNLIIMRLLGSKT